MKQKTVMNSVVDVVIVPRITVNSLVLVLMVPIPPSIISNVQSVNVYDGRRSDE